MSIRLKAKAPFILVVAAAFFVYQLLILANSIEAEMLRMLLMKSKKLSH